MTQRIKFTDTSMLAATALCLSIFSFAGASYAEDNPQPPAQARTMTAYELYVIYRDKSWQWPDGAGRLDEEGRRFTAVAGSGDAASRAEGRWIVTDRGRLCLDARWHASAEAFQDRTCFEHRLDGNTIYQRRSPAGDWYVFKHDPVAADDEFTKLVQEDLVSAKIEEAKSGAKPQQLSLAPTISGAEGNE